MSDTAPLSLFHAARALDVPVRALRRAIRTGKLPAAPVSATAALPPGWLASAKLAIETKPFSWAPPQKVPAFARYEGTSAWRKYRARVREYNRFHATAAA